MALYLKILYPVDAVAFVGIEHVASFDFSIPREVSTSLVSLAAFGPDALVLQLEKRIKRRFGVTTSHHQEPGQLDEGVRHGALVHVVGGITGTAPPTKSQSQLFLSGIGPRPSQV